MRKIGKRNRKLPDRSRLNDSCTAVATRTGAVTAIQITAAGTGSSTYYSTFPATDSPTKYSTTNAANSSTFTLPLLC